MNDDFDLRLRTALGALAEAVPVGPAVRPKAGESGRAAAWLDGSQPVVGRVRLRHGPSVGWSAGAIAVSLAIVAGAAFLGGLRNGQPAVGPTPTGSGHSAATALAGLAGLATVEPHVLTSFVTDDLEGLVLGPDGGAYVLDATAKSVYRVDLQTGARVQVIKAGQEIVNGGVVMGDPRLLATGGGDVLILDDANSLWRWHPAQGDTSGAGSLIRVNIPDSVTWGAGARAIGTVVTNAAQNLYELYVVVPSQHQVIKYAPAPDGSGYPPQSRSDYLLTAQDVSVVDDLYVDGPAYTVRTGKITEYGQGQAVVGWGPPDPGGPAPYYTRLVADNPAPLQGTFYAYDHDNKRIVAFSKADGSFVGQYVAPAGMAWFSALTGMFVTSGSGGSHPTLYWTESGNLMSASLAPSPSPKLTASTGPSAVLPSPTLFTATPASVSTNPGRWMDVTSSMTTDGAGRATRLADGRVLILDSTNARAELYDPKSGEFSPTGSTLTASSGSTATLLHDGRVLVTGFSVKVNVADGYYYEPLSSAEIYDPSKGSFSTTGSTTIARFGATATLLQDGRVLFLGGSDGSNAFTSAEIYEPATGKFSPTGSMLNPRSGHAATLLGDGRVLITGGVDHSSATLVAEIFDPKTGKFSATYSMIFAAASQTATLLADGRVLIAGGGDEGDPITASAELYDPASGIFTSTGPMCVAREIFTATLLPDGRVLVVGGNDGTGTLLASAELFDPKTGEFSGAASMNGGRMGQSATLLPDGRVFVTGGGPDIAELYEP
jgi:hypothetical protein